MATLINMQRMSGKDSMPMMAAKKSSRIHTAVGRRGQYRSSEPLGSISPADSRAATSAFIPHTPHVRVSVWCVSMKCRAV